MKHYDKAVEYFYEARRAAENGRAVLTREKLFVAAEEAAESIKSAEVTGVDAEKLKQYINYVLSICKEIRENGLSSRAMHLLGTELPQDNLFAEIFRKKKGAVGRIHSGRYAGTGFVVSPKGYVLTNCHVIADKGGRYRKNVSIDIEEKTFKLTILNADENNDLAVCQLNSLPYCGDIIELVDDSEIQPGQQIMVIGNAFDMALMPSIGEIRYENREEGSLLFRADTNHGDSGGPVLNRYGQCLGVNCSRTISRNDDTVYGFVNAVSARRVKQLLKEWDIMLR